MADDNVNNIPDALEPNVGTVTGLSTLPEAEVRKASQSFQAQQPKLDSIALPSDQLEAFQTAILGDESQPVDSDFDVLDTNGQLKKVAGKDLKEVLSTGAARLVSAEEKQDLEDQINYGEKQAQATLLGAARGLTFGASDQVLESSGAYQADELRGIENANTGYSIGGEVAGAAIPAFFSGGTSALATGAEMAGTGVRLIEQFGAKAGARATQALIKQGVSKGAAAAIAKRLLPEIVDLGVQGAAQGVGRLVTENAFGTADFNAQNLIAYAGMGSLVGGTFGAALGMGKALAPSVKSITRKLGDKADDVLSKVFNREESALELSGLSVADTVKAEAQNPKFKTELANEIEDILNKKKPKTYEDFYDSVSKSREEAGIKIGNVYKEADEQLAKRAIKVDAEPLSSNIMRGVDDYLDGLGNAVKADKATYDGLRKFGTDFAELIAKDTHVTTASLQKEAKALQDRVFKGKSFGSTLTEGTMADLQDVILKEVRAYQRDMVMQADKTAFTNLIPELEQANKSYQILKGVNKASDKAAERLSRKTILDKALETKSLIAAAVNPSFGAAVVGTRLAMESFNAQKWTVMGKLQTAHLRTAMNINKIANNIGNFSAKIANSADDAAFRHITSFELAKMNGKKPSDEQTAYQNIRENLANMASDPESVLRKSNKSTAAIFDHAPETAAKIDATFLAAMQFLNTKTKKSSKKKGAFDFLTPDNVSTLEIGKMNRYLEAIEDPNSVLKKAAKGKISREGVEVLKNIYPDIFKTLQLKTLDKVHKTKTKLTYQNKLSLGLLLDVKAHESMDHENVMNLQAVISSPAASDSMAADGNNVSYSPSRVENVQKGQNMASLTQEKGEV